MALGIGEAFDDGTDEDVPEVSPVVHHTYHHCAFEVRQDVLDEFWHSGKWREPPARVVGRPGSCSNLLMVAKNSQKNL
jgi:hypothetical protein